jgi:hypothetical protein
MNNFIKISATALAVGIIAAILVFVDSLIAPFFAVGISFTWMAFINWTVFFGSSKLEKFKAILGFIIGYLAANSIVFLGKWINNNIDFKIINISISTIIAVFIVNFLVMYFEKAKKLFMDSIPGIFVGIALTFSGAGIGIETTNLKLLIIILIYGALGILCGVGTNYLERKIKKY